MTTEKKTTHTNVIHEKVLNLYRTDKTKTVQEIANELDITRQYVSHILIENGEQPKKRREKRTDMQQREEILKIATHLKTTTERTDLQQTLGTYRHKLSYLVSLLNITLLDLGIVRRFGVVKEIETLRNEGLSQLDVSERMNYHPNTTSKYVSWLKVLVDKIDPNLTGEQIANLPSLGELYENKQLTREYFEGLSVIEKMNFASEISKEDNETLLEELEYPVGVFLIRTIQESRKLLEDDYELTPKNDIYSYFEEN